MSSNSTVEQSANRARPARRRAFTLFEVLLVILIIAIVAGLAWPSFSGTTDAERIRETATRMKAMIAMCRAEAMNEARRFRVQFFADGSIELAEQYDPLGAAQEFLPVRRDWAHLALVLDDVWVETVVTLPDGPPPIIVEDELIEFDAAVEQIEPIKVEELDEPLSLYFEPDGSSGSARWTLRDTAGRALEMTLDGRLGRVEVKEMPRIAEGEIERPPQRDPREKEEAELQAEQKRITAQQNQSRTRP